MHTFTEKSAFINQTCKNIHPILAGKIIFLPNMEADWPNAAHCMWENR